MYGKVSDSWMKHWDFILLDLLGLQLCYVLSCCLWNGGKIYTDDLYLNMGIIIALADICVVFFSESYKGIMRRGYFQEFKSVCRHIIWILFLQVLYLFLSKRGAQFSRMVMISSVVFAVAILYTIRVVWKRVLLRKNKLVYKKKAILLVVDHAHAARVAATVENHTFNELEICGMVVVDRSGGDPN